MLFDLDKKNLFISRDVSFREGIFPFRSMQIENEEDVLFMPITDMTSTNMHSQDHNVSVDQPPTTQHEGNSAGLEEIGIT